MPITQSENLAAFPDYAPYQDEVTGCPPEIFDIDRDLRGRSWRDLGLETCVKHSNALLMLDTKPLKYFLPAFLIAALKGAVSVAAESLVYFTCSKAFDAIANELDSRQRDAVLGTVETVMNGDHGYFAGETDLFLKQLERYRRRG